MKFEWHFGWQNWTFGVWWGRFGPAKMRLRWGIDFGPLEMMWTREIKK